MMLLLVLLLAVSAAAAETIDTLYADGIYETAPVFFGDGICAALTRADGTVRVQILSERGKVLYDKDYGPVSGEFVSDVVYLANGGLYTMNVIAGGMVYTVPFELQRGTAPLPTEYGWMDGGF